MPSKTFEQAIVDFMQAIGMLVRRTRSESYSDELSF